MSSDDDRDENQFEDERENDDEEKDEEDEPLEDEEEEEEEEDYGSRRKKKARKESNPASYFISMEAEEEDDEEDEEYDDEADLLPRESTLLTREPMIENRATHRKTLFDADKSVEEIAKEFEERHRNYYYEDEEEEDEDGRTSTIKKVANYPSFRDPKLWMVKCKNGKERNTALMLMRRYLDRMNTNEQLYIKSAIAPDHLKGYIYVEADKESHVKNAIKGLRNLQEWNTKLVPTKEMPDVLTQTRKNITLRRGDWVRVKTGLYKGDIAQVIEYDESRARVIIKIIPRLDNNGSSSVEHTGKDGKKRKIRMPSRFFNPDEIGRERLDRKSEGGEYYWIYNNNRYKDGYLYKSFNIKTIDINNVIPSLDELQRFQDKSSSSSSSIDMDNDSSSSSSTTTTMDDISSSLSTSGSLLRSLSNRRISFMKGDTVIVIDGDLKHLMGTVDSVDGNTVTVIPKHEELKELLTFPSNQLQKYFKRGDHVKVMSGKYEGDTGLIIRVEDNIAIIFSDSSMKEYKVLVHDIQLASEVSSGKIQLGNYELHDLVYINPHTVAVIIRIERDSFKLLDNNGNIQTVRLQEMGTKRSSKDSTAFDSHQNQVGIGDVVRVVDGIHKGKQGTIRHLYKYFAFLHSRDVTENGGIFVVRTSNFVVLGGKRGSIDSPNSTNIIAGQRGFGFIPGSPGPRASWKSPSPARTPSRGGAGSSSPSPVGMGGGVVRRGGSGGKKSDPLLDKDVVIKSGQYKGLHGIVKETTDSIARVELHTNSKVVTVSKDQLRTKDGSNPSDGSGNLSSSSSGGYGSSFPPSTPYYDPTKTPLRPSDWDLTRTPSRGAPSTPLRHVPATPIHGTAWDPNAPTTPARNQTPSLGWGDTDNTGGWGSSSSSSGWTPSTPGGGYQPSTVGSSSTSSSSYNPYSPAPSSQHTPGSDYYHHHNPSTPSGAFTPGTGYSAHTPEVTTPYSSYQPNTPGTPGMMGPTTPKPPVTPGSTESYIDHTPSVSVSGSGSGSSLLDKEGWCPNIEVRIIGDTYKNGQYKDETSIVRSISMYEQSCKVTLTKDPHIELNVPFDSLDLVQPGRKDQVIILRGEHKGSLGTLAGIDGRDGIVKMNSNYDIKILDLNSLAKFIP